MSKRLNPETILSRQASISESISKVRELADAGKPLIATFALSSLIDRGKKIDYVAIGQADISAFNDAEAAQANVNSLLDEQSRLREWTSLQDGAPVSDALLKKITGTLRRTDRIQRVEIPKAERLQQTADLAAEEVAGLSEITGEAWPYYPALAQQAQDAMFATEAPSDTVDAKTRRTVHNIISRLATDSTLGLPYAKFTTHLFAHADGDEKSNIAKALPAMQHDGEIQIWQENGTRYIRSLSSVSAEETNAKRMVVLEINLDDDLSEQLIREIYATFGAGGYRRIESGITAELQVPRSFAQEFAANHGLTLARRGPSSYQFIAN